MACSSFSAFSGIPPVFFALRRLEKGEMLTSDVYFPQLTQIGDTYRPQYGTTVQMCGPILRPNNASLQTINQKETLNFDVLRHSLFNPNMALSGLHLFCSLRNFLTE